MPWRSPLALHRPFPLEVPLSLRKARRGEPDGSPPVLPVDLVDRLHQILVFFPHLAEQTLLVRAARADVIQTDARLLVAVAAPVDQL